MSYIKKVGISILVFFLGYFLIKKGIDYQKVADLELERVKEEQMKHDAELKLAEEKKIIEENHAKELKKLEEDNKKKEIKLKKQSEEDKKILKKEAKEKPQEFGKKFGKKFKLNYDKDK